MQEACNDGIASIASPHDEAPSPATRSIVPGSARVKDRRGKYWDDAMRADLLHC